VDRRNCVVSAASFIDFLGSTRGVSLKYLSGYLNFKNAEYAADGELSTEVLWLFLSKEKMNLKASEKILKKRNVYTIKKNI
jgi:hypothetical protein